MSLTFGDKVIQFNEQLTFNETLPKGFRVLNPFLNLPETLPVMRQFYHQYYGDFEKRRFIIGINPSRHGAAVTGVPFTDTKRLEEYCGISMSTAYTHEISSVFIYDVIKAYGGVDLFYKDFYINSPFPLAIVKSSINSQWLNANYYDQISLFEALKPSIIKTMEQHIQMGLKTKKVYILGKKNAQFLERINKEVKWFDEAVVLDHPRYIQQYKFKEREHYIHQYVRLLKS